MTELCQRCAEDERVEGSVFCEICDLVVRSHSLQPLDGSTDKWRGQCLRYAAAASLRIPPSRLPEVRDDIADRFGEWQRELAEAGYRIEDLSLAELPPADGQPWIAIVPAAHSAHAVACVGMTAIGEDAHRWPVQREQVLSAFRVVDAVLVPA